MEKWFVLFFFILGCVSNNQKEFLHRNSCGVEALYLQVNQTKEKINKDILNSNHNYKRYILSIFNEKSWQITFPEEILDELHKAGLKTTIIKGTDDELRRIYSQLNRCILLIRNKSNIIEYHWQSSPFIQEDLEPFGKNNNEIIMIIWIHK